MTRPIVGIIGNFHLINDQYPAHAGGTMNSEAVADVSGCMPLIVPSDPRYVTVPELLERCDGFLLTGGRPNVHPEEYGHEPTEAHGEFDRARDAISLPLVRECLTRGQPLLAVCRGFQEVNVAMGGTLHPEIRELPGRDNHRMPRDATLDEQFALRHSVSFTEDGPFHRLMGAREVMTNTLHGQGVMRAGPRIVIDGHAPDGTPEALYVERRAGLHARGAVASGIQRCQRSRFPAPFRCLRRCGAGLGGMPRGPRAGEAPEGAAPRSFGA